MIHSKPIDNDYENFKTKGYTRITNDILNCNRLSSIQLRLLIIILNSCNSRKSKEARIKKLDLEDILDINYSRLRQLAVELEKMGFLFSSETLKEDYSFTIAELIDENAYISISELDKKILGELRKLKKSDKDKVRKILKSIRGGKEEKQFIEKLKKQRAETVYIDYKEFILSKIREQGINIPGEHKAQSKQKEIKEAKQERKGMTDEEVFKRLGIPYEGL